jgi:hypothetical protein
MVFTFGQHVRDVIGRRGVIVREAVPGRGCLVYVEDRGLATMQEKYLTPGWWTDQEEEDPGDSL